LNTQAAITAKFFNAGTASSGMTMTLSACQVFKASDGTTAATLVTTSSTNTVFTFTT